MDAERCTSRRCSKRRYRRYDDAARDCRAIRRRNKRERTLHPYWSKACEAFHLTHDHTRKARST